MALHIRSHASQKDVPSAIVGTVYRWCQDYAAGLEKSSIGEVTRLQNFCHQNHWVFVAPCKLKCQLTAESAECCRTWDSSCRPNRGACPDSEWRMRQANLNLMHSQMGSQWYQRDMIAASCAGDQLCMCLAAFNNTKYSRQQQGNRRYQTLPWSGAAPPMHQFDYNLLSQIHYAMLSHFEHSSLSRHLFLAIMCKYNVTHKTGSTYHIAMPPEEDRTWPKITYANNLAKVGCIVTEICS